MPYFGDGLLGATRAEIILPDGTKLQLVHAEDEAQVCLLQVVIQDPLHGGSPLAVALLKSLAMHRLLSPLEGTGCSKGGDGSWRWPTYRQRRRPIQQGAGQERRERHARGVAVAHGQREQAPGKLKVAQMIMVDVGAHADTKATWKAPPPPGPSTPG